MVNPQSQQQAVSKVVAGGKAYFVFSQEDVSVDDDELLKLGVLRLKESISDVCLAMKLGLGITIKIYVRFSIKAGNFTITIL